MRKMQAKVMYEHERKAGEESEGLMSQTPSLLYEYRQVGRKRRITRRRWLDPHSRPCLSHVQECLARLLETTDTTFPPLPFISFIVLLQQNAFFTFSTILLQQNATALAAASAAAKPGC